MNTTEIAERLATIETIVTRLESRLLGNGQPGELYTINTRLDSLEDTQAKARGALWIISAVVTFITSGGLLRMFRSR